MRSIDYLMAAFCFIFFALPMLASLLIAWRRKRKDRRARMARWLLKPRTPEQYGRD